MFKDFGKNTNTNNSNNKTLSTAEEYLREGLKYHEKKDYEKAILLYSKCLELDAKKYMCYHNHGVSYRDKGDYDKAITDATKVIQLVPSDWGYYQSRGEAYLGNKQYQNAIDDFDDSIRLNPNYPGAFVGRGNAKYLLTGYSLPSILDYCSALRVDKFNEPARRGLAQFPSAKCP